MLTTSNGSRRTLTTLGVVLAAALLCRAAAAGPTCPGNRVVFTLGSAVVVNATSAEAVLDTSASYTHGSYDLVQGLLTSNVSFYDLGSPIPRWAGSSVDTENDYWIVGLAPGTPVDFTAELTVSGSWNVYPGVPQGEFSAEAFVSVDEDTARYSRPLPGGCCIGTIAEVLSLPLHRGAQEPFRLRLRLASQNYRGRVDAAGRLQFTGLPPGATVVSCQTQVTPTRSHAWGQLKVRYR